MTKEQFLEILNKDPTEVTTPQIIEVCQYYIDKFSVDHLVTKNVGGMLVQVGIAHSKLDFKIEEGSHNACIKAFTGLKKRINEFKD
jgi:hypothetical protein